MRNSRYDKYEALPVGPWGSREGAFTGMNRAMAAKAEELGGRVSWFTLRRNGNYSYGARGQIRMTGGKNRVRNFEAGVI